MMISGRGIFLKPSAMGVCIQFEVGGGTGMNRSPASPCRRREPTVSAGDEGVRREDRAPK